MLISACPRACRVVNKVILSIVSSIKTEIPKLTKETKGSFAESKAAKIAEEKDVTGAL